MKAFLVNFAGSFAACVTVAILAYFNTLTKGAKHQIKHYLTPEAFPMFALTIIGISLGMALFFTLLRTLLPTKK